jgi:uncharacterized protein (DUF2384 family)
MGHDRKPLARVAKARRNRIRHAALRELTRLTEDAGGYDAELKTKTPRDVELGHLDPAMPHLVEKLHDPASGKLHARRVAAFFGMSVSDLARTLEKRLATVSKTPDAPALQDDLRRLAAIASGLLRVTGSHRRARVWLQAPHPALEGHAPIELLHLRKVTELGEFVQDMLEGRPS